MSRRERTDRRRGPTRVGPAVDRLLRGLGVDRVVERYRVLERWEDVVGPEVAAHARPEGFSGDCLVVAVDHPGWMHQLHYLRGPLLEKVNRELGRARAAELRFRLGPPPPRPRRPASPVPPPALLPAEAEEEIRGQVAGIRDPEIREGLRRVLRRDRARRDRARAEADREA